MARRGRPRIEDDEAIYLIRGLVEEHDQSIRSAARLVALHREYPQYKTDTFVEWARKEYARRRDLGTLPELLPLPREREKSIRTVFRRQQELALEAREILASAETRAQELGLEVSDISHRLLEECHARLWELEDLTKESPRHFALRMQREGLTEDETVERAKELAVERILVAARLSFIRDYLAAHSIVERVEGD